MEPINASYHIAKGQEALEDKLKELWEKSRLDAAIKKQPQDIIYHLGGQYALVKVDLGREPIKFWHEDFAFGRAASKAIQHAIINFCKNQLNEKNADEIILENHFIDRSLKKTYEVQSEFRRGLGKMNINKIEPVAPETQRASIQTLQTQLASQLPDISAENVRALLNAQAELKSLTSVVDYSQQGKHSVKFFDRAAATEVTPAIQQTERNHLKPKS